MLISNAAAAAAAADLAASGMAAAVFAAAEVEASRQSRVSDAEPQQSMPHSGLHIHESDEIHK